MLSSKAACGIKWLEIPWPFKIIIVIGRIHSNSPILSKQDQGVTMTEVYITSTGLVGSLRRFCDVMTVKWKVSGILHVTGR